MSHKCLRCGALYQDYDNSILRGCTSCGSIFFLFMKNEQDAKELNEIEKELQTKDTTLEQELNKKIEEKKAEIPIVKEEVKPKIKKIREKKFTIETIRVPKEGVYEINLDALMRKRPLVILEKGKVYFIHLPSAFGTVREREKS